jgi:hypothetical protein
MAMGYRSVQLINQSNQFVFQITLPFKLEWLYHLFEELAMLVFFVVTGIKFRPATDNPYLQVPQDDDDEIEMEEV